MADTKRLECQFCKAKGYGKRRHVWSRADAPANSRETLTKLYGESAFDFVQSQGGVWRCGMCMTPYAPMADLPQKV